MNGAESTTRARVPLSLGFLIATAFTLFHGYTVLGAFKFVFTEFLGRVGQGILWAPTTLVSNPRPTLAVFAYTLSAIGAGRTILRTRDPLWSLFLVGTAAHALFALILGSLSVLVLALVVPYAVGFAFIGARECWQTWKDWRQQPDRRWTTVDLAIALLWSLPLLVVCLHPSVFYDAQVYHLSLPKLYAETGSTFPPASHVFAHFPALAPLRTTLAFVLGGQRAAQLVTALDWMGVIFALRASANLLGGPIAGRLALVLAAGSPAIFGSTTIMGIDVLVMSFGAAGLYYLLRAEERDHLKFGLFLGALVASKTTAVGFAVLPMTLGALLLWPKAEIVRRFPWVVATAAGVAFPFYLRTWLATGNPVYPVNIGIGPALSPAILDTISIDAHVIKTHALSISSVLKAFGDLLIKPPSEIEGPFGVSAYLGPSVFAGLVLARPKDRKTAVLWVVAILAMGLLASKVRMVRFALPGLSAAVILSAVGLARLGRLGTVVSGLAGLIGLVVSLSNAAALTAGLGMVAVKGSESAYLKGQARIRALEAATVPLFLETASRFPTGKLLILGEPCSLYAGNTQFDPSAITESRVLTQLRTDSAAQVFDTLRGAGVTHVLARKSEVARLSKRFAQPLDESTQARLDELLALMSPVLSMTDPMSPKTHKIIVYSLTPPATKPGS